LKATLTSGIGLIEEVAVKRIKNTTHLETAFQDLKYEIKIMTELHHQNIVQIKGFVEGKCGPFSPSHLTLTFVFFGPLKTNRTTDHVGDGVRRVWIVVELSENASNSSIETVAALAQVCRRHLQWNALLGVQEHFASGSGGSKHFGCLGNEREDIRFWFGSIVGKQSASVSNQQHVS
jgi:serine/threonine protein kinase